MFYQNALVQPHEQYDKFAVDHRYCIIVVGVQYYLRLAGKYPI